MKRAFSTGIFRLAKRRNQDLQTTLKFLAQTNQTTTISSLFDKQGSAAGHVQKVVDLLNHELPDGQVNRRRVDAHYDILMSRLKQVVEKTVAQTEKEENCRKSQHMSFSEKFSRCQSSEQLYGLLLELQVSQKLTPAALIKIVMNQNFTHLNEVRENLPGFSHELELAAMICYRLRGSESRSVYNLYTQRWSSAWYDMAPVAQKLAWKCDYRVGGIPAVRARIENIGGLTTGNFVGLYQSLYAVAHQLPSIPDQQLTNVQRLFMRSLRAISAGASHSDQARKSCLAIVKASLENRLGTDCTQPTEENGTSVYQYRFMRRLDVLLQASARDPLIPEGSRGHILDVLHSLHDEEAHARSQMVLRFI
ncbi:LADA_0E04984g1_1 [Lachancea dasiensis]|uniref:LADA_0E04984g1_1 n=1 Tax=Lachancea dasiensis TaxID=1072105 RepID=A0A1G4JBX7_9SACH|nr:LADA_0E04984g1_1 [Lachancea dasiensis]